MALAAAASPASANELLFVTTGEATRAPIGWVEFCGEHPVECKMQPRMPRDVVLSNKAWTDLIRINKWVNENVTPMTDMDHWGVVEKWSYPDDGYGDCEDYALLKRRMLIEAGWPRAALLITVSTAWPLPFFSRTTVISSAARGQPASISMRRLSST